MSDDDRAGAFVAASIRMLWKRRSLCLASAATVMALTIIFLVLAPSRYTSDAALIIEPRESSVIEAIETLIPAEIRDRDLARNHAAILRSRSLAEKVIAELELEADPDFNSHADDDADGDGGGGAPALRQRARVLEAFDSALTVTTQSQSRVIKVKFTASAPEKAHAVLDSLVRHYLEQQVEAQSGVTGQAETWLENRLRSLRSKLDELDASIEEFQKSVGFIGEYDSSLVTLSLFHVENTLAHTSSEKAQVKTRIAAIERSMDPASPGATDVPYSALGRSLRDHEIRTRARRDELATKYGENDSRVRDLDTQISNLNTQLSVNAQSTIQELQDEFDSLRASESALEGRRKSLQQRLATINENQWHLNALLQERDAIADVYEGFLERFRGIQGQQEIAQPNAVLISPASFPVAPSFPRARLVLVLAVVVSLFVGVLVVSIVETFGPAFRESPVE